MDRRHVPHRFQFSFSNAHSGRKPQPRHIDLAKHDEPHLLVASGAEFGDAAVFHLPGVEHPWRPRDDLVFRYQRTCRRLLVPRRRSTAVASVGKAISKRARTRTSVAWKGAKPDSARLVRGFWPWT